MLTIKDKNQEEIGQLENAFNIGNYERRANQLSSFSFSLPKDDPKNELCNHFNYVDLTGEPIKNEDGEEVADGRYYGLFRIMPKETKKSESDDSVSYTCEHVLATLLDDVMLDYHQFTNWTTRDVIEALLDMQTVNNWQLGTCDFERFFHYSFENENGLLAPILSVPQPFNEPYLFTFETTSYPWTINLVQAEYEPMWDMVWTRDMVSFDEVSDPSEIVNRIYPKGYGEGVNQLTIEEANNGVPYVEDTDSINEWGLHQYIWADRRFEDAETLKANAESLLDQWKDPKISFTIKSVDLSIKEEFKHLQRPFYTVGDIVVDDTTYQARIIGEKIPDLSKEHEVQYEIENKLDDIAETQANLERKIAVNNAYSQGATNHDTITLSDNCDENFPLRFRVWIPEDAININTMILTYETTYFRGYTKGMEDGGYFQQPSVVKSESTESGGAYTKDEVVVSETTEGGGGETTTSAGSHRHGMFHGIGYKANDSETSVAIMEAHNGLQFYVNGESASGLTWTTEESSGEHSHTAPVHTHGVQVTIPGMNIEPHTHGFSVEIPAIEIPSHSHQQIFGIYEHNELPNELTITVDGNELPSNATEDTNVDLVPYLQKDSSGKITRNRWATIDILPDSKAKINASVVTRLFIQSRLGGKY